MILIHYILLCIAYQLDIFIKVINKSYYIIKSILHRLNLITIMQNNTFVNKTTYKHPEKQHILNAFINILNSKKLQNNTEKINAGIHKGDQKMKRIYQQQTDFQGNDKYDDCTQVIKQNIMKTTANASNKTYRKQNIQIQLPLSLISSKNTKIILKQPSKSNKASKTIKPSSKNKNFTSILQYQQDHSIQQDYYQQQQQQTYKCNKKNSKAKKKMQKAEKKMQYKQSQIYDDEQIQINVSESQIMPTKLQKSTRDQIYIQQYQQIQQIPQINTKIYNKSKQYHEEQIEIVVVQCLQLKKDVVKNKKQKSKKKQKPKEINLVEEEEIQEKITQNSKFKEFSIVIQFVENLQLLSEVKKKKNDKKSSKLAMKKVIKTVENNQDHYQPEQQTVQVVRDYTKPYRLGNLPLKELVKQLLLKKIIKQQIYNDFIAVHSNKDIQDFITKFRTGKLHHFNYKQIKFTLLDHRRITQLLLSLYPTDYFLGQIYDIDPQSDKFLNSLYDMSAQAYYNLFNKIDKISKIKWWSKMLITYEDKLEVNHKEKIIAKRQAQQASLAVQQTIKTILHKSNEKEKIKKNICSINLDDDSDEIEKKNNENNFNKEYEKKKQKQRLQNKQKEQSQLNKIRNIVANFGKKIDQNQNLDAVSKKVKFY